ncbi:hypothetical protein [Corynebacterium glyciniphilum]|uniref:hypothetical protein n=2 Tax=Corynebacterium glyciniphilum TaxID=1404244 RepID=UPI0026541FB2|nr:hypothetical protein [Corynebacterium glyciniphilum]MDN6706795.1 hypothetical protein [Corynebacterium glyciniphilum]
MLVLRRLCILLLVFSLCLWGWFALTKIYLPRLDPLPSDVDVLMQVGGVRPADVMDARVTAQERDISDLVISDPTGVQRFHDTWCAPLDGVRVHCFAPDPSTTRGEAQEFARLASEHQWASAMVLATGREHVERVRLYFSRCWDGELSVNRPASSRPLLTHVKQAGYQTAGWARAMTTLDC